MLYDRTFCSQCKRYGVHFGEITGREYCMGHESHKFEDHKRTKLDRVQYIIMEQNFEEGELVKLLGFVHDQIEYKRKVQEVIEAGVRFN